jgi:hypothetical protein
VTPHEARQRFAAARVARRPSRYLSTITRTIWNELWWVRADGTGRAVDPQDPEGVRALSLLADRYPCFAALGAVLAVDVRRWSGWAASAATPGG